jgi:hypothetical protein
MKPGRGRTGRAVRMALSRCSPSRYNSPALMAAVSSCDTARTAATLSGFDKPTPASICANLLLGMNVREQIPAK